MASACSRTETVVAVDPADDSRALVHYANCSTEVVKMRLTKDKLRVLELKHRGIRRVESVPMATQLLDLSWNPSVSADMSSFDSISAVYLRGCALRSLEAFEWPPRLLELNLRANELSNFDESLVPSSIRKLKLSQNHIESLDGLSRVPNLEILLASENHIRSLATFPKKLKELDVSENRISELKDLCFPHSLQKLNISFNAIANVSNVSFPSSLRLLDMKGNAFQSFEMYESDAELFRDSVTVLSRITDWSFDRSSCQAPSSLRWIGLVPVCVIIDKEQAGGGSSDPGPGDQPSPFGGMKEQIGSEDQTTGLLVAGGTTAVLLVVLVLFGITLITGHRQRQRRRTLQLAAHSDTKSKSDVSQTTDPSTSNESITASQISLVSPASSSVFVDGAIPLSTLVRKTTVKTGSNEEIYVAYAGQRKYGKMIVKVINDRSESMKLLMESEIQQCEALQHPNLVRFLGSVTEESHAVGYACAYHADHFDLGTVLARTKIEISNTFSWLSASTSSRPPKLCIALRILEALLFVQQSSQVGPASHKSLNSRSVLVTADWRSVRLSLFSIFRKRSLNEVMTSNEIPWVAPEVLKGGSCGSQANVYSFGIILAHLDTCEQPYHDGVEGFLPRNPSNTRIAIMVGSGSVQPALDPECPHPIRSLIKKCLNFEPIERPALIEVQKSLFELQDS